MAQERGLALLWTESEIAKTIDYGTIPSFSRWRIIAAKKDRQAALWVWHGTAAVTEQYDIIDE